MAIVSLKNDLDVYYETFGEGSPVLFVQGLAGDHTSSAPVHNILKENYKVYTYDARATGQTPYDPDQTISIEMMAEDLACFVDAVDLKQFHLIGISMGGLVVQEYAAQNPEKIKSLTCLCTASSGPNAYVKSIVGHWGEIVEKVGYTETLKGMFNWVYTPEFFNANHEVLQAALAQISQIEEAIDIKAFKKHIDAIVNYDGCFDRVQNITCPSLVMCGSKDILTTPAGHRELAQNMQNASFVMIENECHGFVTDAAEKICQHLIPHLQRSENA